MSKREQERHRPDQVRSQPLKQQRSLPERLAHEPDIELLEITQAAVDELARAGRGTRAEVPGLDQPDRQAAADGVERDARPDNAAADHEDLVLGAGQRVQGGRALGRA